MIKCPGCPHKQCIGSANCNDPARGEMVKEFRCSDGTIVQFYDGFYRNATPEELKRRRQNMENTVWNLLRAAAERGDLNAT